MKTTKIITIATIITIIAMIATAYAMPATAETLPEDFYELDAIVIGWERIGDTNLRVIECLAEDGNVWSFYDDANEWHIGDRLILVMWECTEDEEDDEVVDVIWTEFLEADEMFRFLRDAKW